jgi:hypothetical protein
MKFERRTLDVILEGDKAELNYRLAIFKERGVVDYGKVLSVPTSDRINQLSQNIDGRRKVSAALSAALKSGFENINLRVGMTADQIVELAEQIIDQSQEDNLAIEDVLLFLQQLITGKAGKIYDRMDIPTFFELFENYRQERYEKIVSIRNEQHNQYKTYGDTGERLSDNMDKEKELSRSALGDYLKNKWSNNEAK